jgi:uridine phosphorylase
MFIPPSEMILNADQSIYHLKLKPGEIATKIITVGDQERVSMVAEHLDSIEVERQSREFRTITGRIGSQRLTIISTGIGTDNIDIVFNELDALVNIDFETRTVKPSHTTLDFIRIGTSGAISESVPLDSIVVSKSAIGYDGLLHFYRADHIRNKGLEEAVTTSQFCYAVDADEGLYNRFIDIGQGGITITAPGFYGPQARHLRLQPDIDILEHYSNARYGDTPYTNLEMETAGIYGLAKLLGHRALSLNAILANRVSNVFSTQPQKTIEKLINDSLKLIVN